MRCRPFHARNGLYYHDNDQCPFSRSVDPDDRIPGSGGLGECLMCRRLNNG